MLAWSLMDLHGFKRDLQDHLSDGLVIIVGSGLSVAEGLPGMPRLSEHLQGKVRRQELDDESGKVWLQVQELLKRGMDLEAALQQHPPTLALEARIQLHTARLLLPRELNVYKEVIQHGRVLRFTRLLKHLLKPPGGIPVITTNYDRLLELATERAGLELNTLSVGQYAGRFDEKRSTEKVRIASYSRKGLRYTQSEHVLLLKPHGSLDWFLHGSEPLYCGFLLGLPNLIITPGLNKFRSGYERPFDQQRERANREIDRAARYLIIGYGFNDEHLQTHLAPQLRAGKPALLLTYQLSEAAERLRRSCPNLTVITTRDDRQAGATIYWRTEMERVEGDIWDLGQFITEVLEP